MIPSLKGKRYGFGGGWYRSENNSTCGAHLCAILPNGEVSKGGRFGQGAGSVERTRVRSFSF